MPLLGRLSLALQAAVDGLGSWQPSLGPIASWAQGMGSPVSSLGMGSLGLGIRGRAFRPLGPPSPGLTRTPCRRPKLGPNVGLEGPSAPLGPGASPPAAARCPLPPTGALWTRVHATSSELRPTNLQVRFRAINSRLHATTSVKTPRRHRNHCTVPQATRGRGINYKSRKSGASLESDISGSPEKGRLTPEIEWVESGKGWVRVWKVVAEFGNWSARDQHCLVWLGKAGLAVLLCWVA